MAEQMTGMTAAEREALETRARNMSAMDRAFGGFAEPTDFDFWPSDPTLIGCAETFDADQTAMLAEANANTRGPVTADQVTMGGLAHVAKL